MARSKPVVTLRAIFPKRSGRDRVARYEWSDGLVATTPLWGRPTRLPHDLEHYAVEAVLRPAYGFWNLAAQQAPFDSLTPLRGRWPKGRQEWFDRVRRKHREAMLKAEALGIRGLEDPSFDVDAAWPQVKVALERPFAFNEETTLRGITKADVVELRRSALELHGSWRQVPDGGALAVSWPPMPASKPEVLA